MAGIAQLGTLVSALSNLPGASDSHVWIDPQLGLVMGVYPSPYSRFDFAAEAVELLKPEKAAPKPTISLLGEAKRVVQKYEIETNDAIYVVGSATQLLVQGLDLIERINPGTLERFSKQKKQTKLAKILRLFERRLELNRFEAEVHNDHCLHSTVSALQRRYGIDIERKTEAVLCLGGTETAWVKRYWLNTEPENIARVRALLDFWA